MERLTDRKGIERRTGKEETLGMDEREGDGGLDSEFRGLALAGRVVVKVFRLLRKRQL